jgi:hypothetical protein
VSDRIDLEVRLGPSHRADVKSGKALRYSLSSMRKPRPNTVLRAGIDDERRLGFATTSD